MKKTVTVMLGASLLLLSSCKFINIQGVLPVQDDLTPLELLTDSTLLHGFSGFECSVPADVVYTKGPASFEITASSGVEDKIVAGLRDSILTVRFAERVRIGDRAEIVIKISSETLEYLCLNGAVSFNAEEGIEAGSFRLDSNGASECDFASLECGDARLEFNGASEANFKNLDVKNLRVEINGAGELVLKGRCDRADIEINGTGEVDAGELVCSDINSEVNGIGFVKKPRR